MHRINVIKGTSVEERITDLYCLIMLCVYPLCISNYFVGGDNIKHVLFIILTFLCAGAIVIIRIWRKAYTVTQSNRIEKLAMILVVVLLVTGIGNGLDDFTKATRLVAIAAHGLGFLVVMEYGRAREEQLHLFLCSSVVVCILLLLGLAMKTWGVGYFQTKSNLSAYFLLVITLAMPMFLKQKKGKRKWFYFMMCILMTILLLLCEDKGALLILPFILFSCIMNLKCRMYTIKNILFLLLAILLLLKGFALIITYGGWQLYTEGILHDVTTSILVDVTLVTVAILYSLFLDHTWGYTAQQMKKSHPEVRIMAMRVMEFVLLLMAVGVILCNGISMDKIPFGTKCFVSVLRLIQEQINGNNGAYMQILEAGGVLGLILAILFLLWAIDTLLSCNKLYTVGRLVLIFLITMLLQSFFIPLYSSTTPAYMILLALALGENMRTQIREENDGELI